MIDWQSVLFNGSWILGSAVILAALSYHYWVAAREKHRLRLQLNSPAFLRPFWLGLVFIGIGLAGTSSRVWEIALWIAFTILSFVNLIALRNGTAQE